MTTIKNKFWALLLIASVAFLSCKKQDPLSPIKPVTSTTTTNNPTFTRGQWVVELFQEDSTDETSNFRGYLFTFNSDGTVLAKKDNSNAVTGTWSTVKGSATMKFKISFPSDPLSKLNEDWDVKNETYTDLKLEHVSGGNGGTDYLTFSRYFVQGNTGSYQ